MPVVSFGNTDVTFAGLDINFGSGGGPTGTSTSVNDAEFAKESSLGYVGSLNDRRMQFYTGSSSSINDRMLSYAKGLGYTGSDLNGAQTFVFGLTGGQSLNDAALAFWNLA